VAQFLAPRTCVRVYLSAIIPKIGAFTPSFRIIRVEGDADCGLSSRNRSHSAAFGRNQSGQ
jgi:hypothetical protein